MERKKYSLAIEKVLFGIDDRKLFIGIVFCGTILYLLLLGGKYIWADEAYTFAILRHSYSEMCHITAGDVHPPLYYILLKFFIQPFGYSQAAAKVFSIVPYLMILIMGGIQTKKLFGKKVSFLFMGLFLLFPALLPYAVEIRMYSLAALFVFLCGVYAYRCYEINHLSDWCILLISGIGACYTHYFAMVSVGIIYLLLFFGGGKRKDNGKIIKKWFLTVALSFLLYLPWLKSFLGQLLYKIDHEYWIEPITWKTVAVYVYILFKANGMFTFSLFFATVCFIIFLRVLTIKNKRNRICSFCCLAVLAGTILVGIVASIAIRPVFVIRYAIPALPLFVIFMAIGISEIKNETLLAVIFTVVIMGGISNYGMSLYEEYERTENALDDTFTEKYAECDAYISLTKSKHVPSILAYYERQKPIYVDAHPYELAPYNNFKYIEEWNRELYEKMIVLVDIRAEVPTDLKSSYRCSYLGEVEAYNDIFMDAYLLEKN